MLAKVGLTGDLEMLETEKPQFLEIINTLAAILPSQGGNQLTELSYQAWWLALRDWTLDEFNQAAQQLLANSKWMPTPSDFMEIRKRVRRRKEEAWLLAKRSSGSCRTNDGRFGDGGTCGDELIDRSVRIIGGYRAICECNVDKLEWLQKRFFETYETIQDVYETRRRNPALTQRAGLTQLEFNEQKLLLNKDLNQLL